MIIGASFSNLHSKSLSIDPLQALEEYAKLNLSWIRLSLYWSDIEKQKGQLDFSEYEKLLKKCGELNLKIVLTIGAKAIRWPEFYLPDWVNQNNYENDLLNFIHKCVDNFMNYKQIKIWQIENEPLDPIWPSEEKITLDLLKKEVELARKLDPTREILITIWGNELSKRGFYNDTTSLADIVGLDLYLKQPHKGEYLPPSDSARKIKKIIKNIQKQNKKVFITELQAEPWEEDKIVSKQNTPPSFTPDDFKINFEFAKSLNPDGIFFWGFEYWLWKRLNGDQRYWDEAISLIDFTKA